MVKLVSSADTTGIQLPKEDFIAVPAMGEALKHINGYSMSFSGEPFLYATLKKVFNFLNENGILEKLDQLCFLSTNQDGSLKNWVLIGPDAINNGMPFDAEAGFQSGSPNFIDTAVDPANAKYSLNAGHVSVYLTDVGEEGAGNVAFGNQAGDLHRLIFYPRLGDGLIGYRINSETTVNLPFANHGSPGHYIIQRASANVTRCVFNGSLVHAQNPNPATTLPGGNFTMGRARTTFGSGTIAGWSIGDALLVSRDEEQKLAEAFSLLAAAFVAG